MRRESGDTLVEVIIATTILATAVVAGLGIMNFGFGAVLNSIERTQVQAEITSQLSMARYARDEFVRARGLATGSGGAQAWQELVTGANSSPSATVCTSDGKPAPAANSFHLVQDATGGIRRIQANASEPTGVATAGDGLWLEAVNVTTPSGVNYIDIYAKACWPPSNGTIHQESKSVTRLFVGQSAIVATPPIVTPPVVTTPIISQVDVGNYHVCANSQSGSGYCWGKNDFGALGNGTYNNENSPFAVNNTGVLAGKVIVGTSAGYSHTCVVDNTGRVYCWGYNSQGQLGNDVPWIINNPNPTAVVTSGPLATRIVTKVNGGDAHTCAVTSDGNIYCWGGNNYGQLGTGGANSSVPVEIDMSGAAAGKKLRRCVGGLCAHLRACERRHGLLLGF